MPGCILSVTTRRHLAVEHGVQFSSLAERVVTATGVVMLPSGRTGAKARAARKR